MPKKSAPKARILVVDDDEGVRGLVSYTLSESGYRVTEASGGEEALELLKKRAFDLVILDIMMPGMDGYEVLNRLRAMPSRAETPVIVVTARGHQAAGMIREAAGGVDDHIAKPFQPESLERAVETVLEKPPEQRASRRKLGSRAAGVYEALIELQTGAGDEPVKVRRFQRRD